MTFEELMSSMVTEPKVTEAKKTVSAPSVPVGAEKRVNMKILLILQIILQKKSVMVKL